MPPAVIMACLGFEPSSLFLNPIQLLDLRQPPMGFPPCLFLALCLDRFAKLASGMVHATHMRKTIHRNDCVVTHHSHPFADIP